MEADSDSASICVPNQLKARKTTAPYIRHRRREFGSSRVCSSPAYRAVVHAVALNAPARVHTLLPKH